IITESEHALAIRAEAPASPGHALVVSRRHIEGYFEASAEEKADIWRVVDQVKAYLDREHGADDYRIEFDSVARPEQGFRHLHIRVLPRCVGADPRAGGAASAASLTTGPDKPLARQLFRDLESAWRVDIAVAFVFSAALQSGVLSRL